MAAKKKATTKKDIKYSLKGQVRKIFGRKVKSLRRQGMLPANIYGKKVKSQAINVKKEDFTSVYSQVGETGLVELVVGSLKKPVLIHNVQIHPVTDEPIHADFFQVDLGQKVTATVPVELVGESPAEKSGLGTVVQQVSELEVRALPLNLPEKFQVSISELEEVDDLVTIKDLNYDKKKVEIEAEAERIIVKVEPPQKEEEPEAAPEEEVEEEAVVEGEQEEEKEPEIEEGSSET